MKRMISLITVMFYMVAGMSQLFAQADVKEAQKYNKKERKVIMEERKAQQKMLAMKAVKPARKEAKRLAKEEGWMVFPGALPMEKMIEEGWIKQNEKKINEETLEDENAYIWAVGRSVAETITAAKMEAVTTSQNELASLIESRVASLVTTNIANVQLSTVDAETEQEIVQSAKTLVVQKLQRVEPVLQIYRTTESMKKATTKSKVEKGKVEVQVTLYYDLYNLNWQVQDEIKKTLQEKMSDNEEELKKMMDWQ